MPKVIGTRDYDPNDPVMREVMAALKRARERDRRIAFAVHVLLALAWALSVFVLVRAS